MAKNWTAYEAAKEIYGDNKENITEIGSRFPLLTRTVAMANNEYILDILSALPKVTARVLETGLKENTSEVISSDEDIEEDEVKPAKTKKTKTVTEDEDEEISTYEGMTGKELYALCCKRGISSMCKSRSKDALIELLNKFDNGELETKEEKKASKAKAKAAPKVEEVEDEDDWEDDEEDSDPYAGKNARELFAMCKERGIKAKPKQNASVYADLLKEDDAKEEADTEDEEDDDDDWEI